MNQLNKYVVFTVNEQEFCIPIDYVFYIEKVGKITPIPKSPHYVKGIIHLRDLLTPLFDLKNYLFQTETTINEQNRIIGIKKEEQILGILVDEAKDVLDIAEENIEEVKNQAKPLKVAKLANRLIIILDVLEMWENEDFSKLIKSVQENLSQNV